MKESGVNYFKDKKLAGFVSKHNSREKFHVYVLFDIIHKLITIYDNSNLLINYLLSTKASIKL